MKMKLFLLSLLFLAGCKTESTKTLVIKGTIKNLQKVTGEYQFLLQKDSITLYLNEIPFGKEYNYSQLDSQKISVKDTVFDLYANTKSSGMFDIFIEKDGPMIPLIHDSSNLQISIDFSNTDYFYDVSGSPASKQLRTFINEYIKGYLPEYKANFELDSLKKINAPDSLLIMATNQKNVQIETLNGLLRTYITTATNPYLALYIVGIAQRRFTPAVFEKLLYDLLVKFPSNEELTAYKKQYELFKQQQTAMEKKTWIGKQIPEFSLPDTLGRPTSLSAFKGKYVLIDFWASWCRPCRMENPNVLAAYEKFKAKNFTIVGVSLDKSKDPWMEAIHEDKLSWTHISDLAYWNSEAVQTFGFDGIPYNILVDPEGKVIAEGLRGEGLSRKLSEVLK
jgi:peroxiredoxin